MRPNQSWTLTSIGTTIAGLGGVLAPLSPGIMPVSAYMPVRLQHGSVPIRSVLGAVLTSTNSMVWSVPIVALWNINGATLTNGALPAILGDDSLVGVARICPTLYAAFDGAAEAALAAISAPPYGFRLSANWAYANDYVGMEHFVEFDETPPDTVDSGEVKVRALLNHFVNAPGNYQLGINSAGVPVVARDCGFAALAPEAAVFIDPSDIGNNNEQIPAAVAANTAAHFRFHPSVFVRRTPYIRCVQRVVRDAISITGEPAQPITINSVTTAPTASTWYVVIDGCGQIVTLAHPGGSDLRRPRDIWNSLWVPALQASQSPALAKSFIGSDASATGVVEVLDRLRYLQYARCLNVNGTIVPIAQTGAN